MRLLPFEVSEDSLGLAIDCEITKQNQVFQLDYKIKSEQKFNWPEHSVDLELGQKLYESTCMEFFLTHSFGYFEWNFSPSGEYDFFVFKSYRKEAEYKKELGKPLLISAFKDERGYHLRAQVKLPHGFDFNYAKCSLNAVIDLNGQLSYWALNHPKDKPDFHAAHGFILDF